MANPRIDLQKMLTETLESGVKVYFQAPTKLSYPCLIYERSKIEDANANNKVYLRTKKYTLILIYKDPDSGLPEKLADLPMCKHDRHYVSENLHHDIFTLYF